MFQKTVVEEAIAAALEATEQLFFQLSHNLQETVARSMQDVFQSCEGEFQIPVQTRPLDSQGIAQRTFLNHKRRTLAPLISPEDRGADDPIEVNMVTQQRENNKKKLKAKKKEAAFLFREAAKIKKKNAKKAAAGAVSSTPRSILSKVRTVKLDVLRVTCDATAAAKEREGSGQRKSATGL